MQEVERFKRELKGLNVSDKRLYHRGILMLARQFDPIKDEIARLLWRLQEAGYVVLYQQRDDEGVMGYWFKVVEKINRSRIEEAERLPNDFR